MADNDKKTECKRCGKCCFEPFYRHVTPEDLDDWRAAGRLDLIEAFEKESRSGTDFNHRMAALGLALGTCRFLKPDGPDRFFCEIYELRPRVCTGFITAGSKLCPEYWKDKKEK